MGYQWVGYVEEGNRSTGTECKYKLEANGSSTSSLSMSCFGVEWKDDDDYYYCGDIGETIMDIRIHLFICRPPVVTPTSYPTNRKMWIES